MVDQLDRSLDEIISSNREPKRVYTTKDNMKPQRPAYYVQKKVITKPEQRTFTKRSPRPNIPITEHSGYKQQISTKKPKQFYTEKYYKEQIQLQQQRDQEELTEKAARQERMQQLSQMQQKKKQNLKRLKIENLYHSINNQELRELFETCGELIKLGIEWDDLGYSTGVAYAEYKTEEGASKAIKEYNEAELDGLILKVTFDSQ